jgi:hypothetical protein
VVELNGVTAEATSIYDPRNTLRGVYTLFDNGAFSLKSRRPMWPRVPSPRACGTWQSDVKHARFKA